MHQEIDISFHVGLACLLENSEQHNNWIEGGLKYQKDKYGALRNNILIRYKDFQWENWRTQWSKDGKKLSVPDLTKRLKYLIKNQRNKKDSIPEKPEMPTQKRKEVPVVGTVANQRKKLKQKSIANEFEFDRDARE